MLNQYGDIRKGHKEYDTNYPHMIVEFPRWKDGDLTSWISRVENFSTFTKLQKKSNFVEIASI
ncbi:hypothetical protein BHE74_00054036 [Ensete ventricosum]|nr:hypothetical protein GW17_00058611 [Ensete ventricosum]RWW40544.1 hypothetical protein BHE74_00054036 [Ensete ventricosum]